MFLSLLFKCSWNRAMVYNIDMFEKKCNFPDYIICATVSVMSFRHSPFKNMLIDPSISYTTEHNCLARNWFLLNVVLIQFPPYFIVYHKMHKTTFKTIQLQQYKFTRCINVLYELQENKTGNQIIDIVVLSQICCTSHNNKYNHDVTRKNRTIKKQSKKNSYTSGVYKFYIIYVCIKN